MTEGFENQTPGQLLREARTTRGIDLAAAHDGTKIPIRLLEALERDDYHQVSDVLYVKSFLRSYADWLDLDTEHVLNLFETAMGDPEAWPDANAPLWSEDQVIVRRVGGRTMGSLRLVLMGLAILAGIALAMWFLLSDKEQTAPQDLKSPELSDASREDTPRQEPLQLDPDNDPSEQSPPSAPAASAADRSLGMPAMVPGHAGLGFKGGRTYDLVLRIRLPAGTNCSVSRDGQPGAMPLVWPEDHTPLPEADLKHGMAYAVRGGYAAYWGANDHFIVTLGDLSDVEVTLNGTAMSVARWSPGRPVVLDRSSIVTHGGGP